MVGGPEVISFEFQALLDMNYAVGRIAFDRPEQYRQYVEGLIAYETAGTVPNGREVLYWGPRNRADRATQLSADCLIRPLYEGIPATGDQPTLPAVAEQRRFRSRCLGGPEATRANLLEPLHDADPGRRPAFLFTASHGLEWPNGHERQVAEQGALLCQDWPGLGVPPRPEHCVKAADIGDDAQFHGLVAFLFACHGAGTPAFDQFLADRSKGPVPIAGRPFVAALPRRLLSHPNGPALAVFGHVERAWGFSIRPRGLGPRLRPFRNLLSRVLKGEPVGHATKDLSDRFTASSAQLQPAPRPELSRDAAAGRRGGRALGRVQRRPQLRPARRPGGAAPGRLARVSVRSSGLDVGPSNDGTWSHMDPRRGRGQSSERTAAVASSLE